MAARRHPDDIVDLHFPAGADAQIAVDARIELNRHRRMAEVCGLGPARNLRETASRKVQLVRPGPETRFRIVRSFARGVICQQQFKDEVARPFRPLRIGRDLHARIGLANAGGCEHALTLDLDHAGAAIAVRPVSGLRTMAKVGDVRSATLGGLPDRFPWKRLDFLTVEQEGDALCHRELLDQPAFDRNRLKAEKLIDSKVLEQLIRAQIGAGCSRYRAGSAAVHARLQKRGV